jgi:hypothetical protein
MGLEIIKAKHYMVRNPLDKQIKARQKREIQSYLAWV